MNIGIAGAGLIGRLLAWQLLRRGHRVMLFDRDSRDGKLSAARIAAAMLAPYSEAAGGEREIFEWGRAALRLWPSLLRELQTDSGIDVYFQQRGSVVIAHKADRANLEHFQQLLRHAVANDLAHVQALKRVQLSALEPELNAHFDEGIFLDEEGTLDNRELLAALAVAIEKLGGNWREEMCVDRVEAYAIDCGGESFKFDMAIDARGFGAKAQFSDLRGVRGELLWVHAPEVNLSRPVRLMHPRYQLYIAPKRDHVYVIGATQIESESLASITVRSSLELQSALYSVHTGFAEANVIDAFAGCRPAFFDNLPRIEKAPGVLRVNGLYRHGYLLAPYVLDLALQCCDGHVSHSIVHETAFAKAVNQS
jgi:glycine oxidase